jgi:hypothetical protein
MNFFKLKVRSIGDSKFAWASGYGPIAENIDDIPFLKDAPDILKENLRGFWEVTKRGPGMLFDRGGGEWPDMLGCGMGDPHFFFSQKVVEDLQNYGIPLLRVTEMPPMLPFPKKLKDVPPPKYYVIEGIPGLEVAWAAMGIRHTDQNKADFSKGYPNRWPPKEWKVSLSSWTSLDLMSYKNWQMPMTLVCTDEIRDIAKARKWTNIDFKPLVTVE